MIRVWLVDDDAWIRRELSSALCACASDVAVTSCFESAEAALTELGRGAVFDVALVDLGLPRMAGDVLIRTLRRLRPAAPVVAFTVREDEQAVFSALRAGAIGYLTKRASAAELAAAVRSAAAGAAPLAAEVSRQVVASFWQWDSAAQGAPELTAREREVLELFCTGASYREVGELLKIAEGTVQSHVKNIYSKLGVTSKAEAVRMAMSLHLIERWSQ